MDKPYIRAITKHSHSTKAILFVHGGWCQHWGNKNEHDHKLIAPLKRAGWQESVYHLWWDSSEDFPSNFHKIEQIKDRAKRVGKNYFCDLVSSEVAEKEVSILAYSFGARVVYYALESWSGRHNLNDVFLLGGAINRDSSKNWEYAASMLDGHLFNIYNRKDSALDWLHHYQRGTSACGRKPIKALHPKILNIDVTHLVGKHHSLGRYLEHLPSYIE